MGDSGSKWWHRSLNPFVGCQKASAGCRLCWAEQVATTRLRHLPAYRGVVDDAGWTGEVKEVPGGLDRVSAVRKGIVFLCDMGDIFHGEFGSVRVRFRRVVASIADGARHGSTARFCLLTKRAAMMAKCVEWLMAQPDTVDDWKRALSDRVWLGVSAEDGDTLAWRACYLYGLPCAGTFISAEPLLGSLRRGGGVTLRGVIMGAPSPAACTCGAWHGFIRCPYTGGVARMSHRPETHCDGFVRVKGGGIDWIVTGAQSGVGATAADLEWFGEIIRDGVDTCTPIYMKQVGARPYVRRGAAGAEERVVIPQRGHGGDMAGWAEELRVRQWPLRLIMEAKRWSK
jgi:protein gp37